MVPLTRRRLLHGTAAGLVTLAGCGESSSDSGSARRRRPENVERNPEAYVLRNPSDEPTAWFVREDDHGASETDDSTTVVPPRNARRRGLVASAETAARVGFADVDGVDGASQFIEETDFEQETLYLEERSVRECFHLELCYVTWSQSEIDTQYGSYYRDVDVDCRAEEKDTTAWLIRVPDALDPELVRSHGSGWSSTGCRIPPYLRTSTEEER